jgi:hypothetical protein
LRPRERVASIANGKRVFEPLLRCKMTALIDMKQARSLYVERRIRDLPLLKRFIQALDEDEGLRIEGNRPDLANGGYIFVGFYRSSYCVNLCDRIRDKQSQKYTVGSNDKWFYFEEFTDLWKFLRPLIRKPLRAWLY